MPERKPIFYDQERLRWRRTRVIFEITGAIFTLILVVFLLNVSRNPELPDLLRPDRRGLHAVPSLVRARPIRRGRKGKIAGLGKVPKNYEPLRAAFYVSDDYTSLASLQLHYRDIDLLIPETLHAVEADGTLSAEPDPKLTAFLQSLQKRGVDLPVMSLVNNYDGKKGWCPPVMLQMLANPEARARLAAQLEQYADAERQPGVVVDFESLPKKSEPDFESFVHDLGSDLHARGLKLMVALPAADFSYNYKYFASQADAIILMNYDFHWPTST